MILERIYKGTSLNTQVSAYTIEWKVHRASLSTCVLPFVVPSPDLSTRRVNPFIPHSLQT